MASVGNTDAVYDALILGNYSRFMKNFKGHPDPNTRSTTGSGNTLLHQAVRNTDSHMIDLLINLGADPEAQNNMGKDVWNWAKHFGIFNMMN